MRQKIEKRVEKHERFEFQICFAYCHNDIMQSKYETLEIKTERQFLKWLRKYKEKLWERNWIKIIYLNIKPSKRYT